MVIEGAYIHRWMSVNTTIDEISRFGKITSAKIDSRWPDLYILRPFLGRCEYFLSTYKTASPADGSVGGCSIT